MGCWEEMRGRTPRGSCEEIWTNSLKCKLNKTTSVSSNCAQNVNSLDDAAQLVMLLASSYICLHIELVKMPIRYFSVPIFFRAFSLKVPLARILHMFSQDVS